jgi:ketosteroid isomerase-like protein
MSKNLDLVRSIFADWERGDFSTAEWADPEIEFETFGFDAMKTVGRPDMAGRWGQWMKAWEDYRTEADEYRELDGDRVLVLMRHGGRGRMSGIQVDHLDRRGANLFQIRCGKVVTLTLYWDGRHALSDLGLAD